MRLLRLAKLGDAQDIRAGSRRVLTGRPAARPRRVKRPGPSPSSIGAVKSISRSISPASRKRRCERRAALEQERRDPRAARARRAPRPGPRRAASRRPRPRSAPRRARTRRARAAPARRSPRAASRSAAAPPRSNTTRSGWRSAGGSTSRAVSSGSSASAVPMPTATAPIAARSSCTRAPALGRGDPARARPARPCARRRSPPPCRSRAGGRSSASVSHHAFWRRAARSIVAAGHVDARCPPRAAGPRRRRSPCRWGRSWP